MLLIFKYFACTAYGISLSYYGGKTDPLGGTGQRIKLSGDLCQDKSCLIIKVPEKYQLRVLINTQIIKREIQELCVGFINDTDFFISGELTQC